MISDQEFIKIFREYSSPSAVAKAVGIDVRNVHKRRRSIEKRHGIRLAVIDNRPTYDQSALITDDRIEVKLKITDGVILVTGDQHFWPGSVPVMHRAFVYLMKKIKPFAGIWNGDSIDGANIGRWADIGWEKKPSVSEELEAVKERSYEVIQASPNSKRIWVPGNHCLRFESRLAAVAPQYRNVKGIHLKDHFPEWINAWFVTINEGEQSHTEVRHREKGGIHAGFNNVRESGINIVTGHDHRAEVVAFDDRRGRRYAVRHGMGADSCRNGQFVNYLEGRKTNWQSGLAVLTFRDGRLLQPELALRIDDESFEFRGELIRV